MHAGEVEGAGVVLAPSLNLPLICLSVRMGLLHPLSDIPVQCIKRNCSQVFVFALFLAVLMSSRESSVMHRIICIVYSVQYSVESVQCPMYTEHCTVYNVHCILFISQFTM